MTTRPRTYRRAMNLERNLRKLGWMTAGAVCFALAAMCLTGVVYGPTRNHIVFAVAGVLWSAGMLLAIHGYYGVD